MLPALLSSTVGLLFAVVYVLYQQRTLRALRASLDAEKSKHLTASDDDETLALLEASAEVSPLARKLLAGVNDVTVAGQIVAFTAWKHENDQPTPPEQRWIVCRDELLNEPDDESRAECLRSLLRSGRRFTIWEQSEITKMFTCSVARDVARDLLRPPVNPKDRPLRWSKQKGVALVTITCPCGNPAITWNGSVGHEMEVCCKSCGEKKKKKVDLICSADAVYVAADGVAWRNTGGSWVKTTID